MSKPVNEILSRYEAEGIPISALADRVRYVVQRAFNGRRIAIFSGVASKGRKCTRGDPRHRGGLSPLVDLLESLEHGGVRVRLDAALFQDLTRAVRDQTHA